MASKDRQGRMDALELLMDDHRRVKGLFEEFKKFEESDSGEYDELKQELIEAACEELKVHAQVEEEIFYPQVRDAVAEADELLNEAEVEHESAKELIAQLEDDDASDPMACARFKVLGEYIDHHVREEEDELFPKVRAAKLDLEALGAEMAARKRQLMEESGVVPYDEIPSKAARGEEGPKSLWDRIRSVTNR